MYDCAPLDSVKYVTLPNYLLVEISEASLEPPNWLTRSNDMGSKDDWGDCTVAQAIALMKDYDCG